MIYSVRFTSKNKRRHLSMTPLSYTFSGTVSKESLRYCDPRKVFGKRTNLEEVCPILTIIPITAAETIRVDMLSFNLKFTQFNSRPLFFGLLPQPIECRSIAPKGRFNEELVLSIIRRKSPDTAIPCRVTHICLRSIAQHVQRASKVRITQYLNIVKICLKTSLF